MALKAKSKLVDGVRVDVNTGTPIAQSTGRQQMARNKIPNISSASLTPTPSVNLPPPPTPVAGPALQGALETQATQFQDDFTKNLAAKEKAAEQDKNKSLSDVINELANVQGETALTDKAYSKDGGVDQLDTELQDINNQILQEQEGFRRAKERIETAPGTATAAERNREIREVERESLRKQADLSIIQLSRQGKYDSAKAVADRAIALQLEQQKQRIDTAQFIYEERKDLFTTAEQRAFETLQEDRRTKMDNEEFRLREDYKAMIDKNSGSGSDNSIKLNATERQILLGAGLTNQMITDVESDINEVGIDAVLADPGLTDAQKKAIQQVYGVAEAKPQLTRANLAAILKIEDNDSGKFLGFGTSNKEKLDDYEATIQTYRNVGLSEADILEKLLAASEK